MRGATFPPSPLPLVGSVPRSGKSSAERAALQERLQLVSKRDSLLFRSGRSRFFCRRPHTKLRGRHFLEVSPSGPLRSHLSARGLGFKPRYLGKGGRRRRSAPSPLQEIEGLQVPSTLASTMGLGAIPGRNERFSAAGNGYNSR